VKTGDTMRSRASPGISPASESAGCFLLRFFGRPRLCRGRQYIYPCAFMMLKCFRSGWDSLIFVDLRSEVAKQMFGNSLRTKQRRVTRPSRTPIHPPHPPSRWLPRWPSTNQSSRNWMSTNTSRQRSLLPLQISIHTLRASRTCIPGGASRSVLSFVLQARTHADFVLTRV
jgi:hypothetical protein